MATDTTEEKYHRDCMVMVNQSIGCSEHTVKLLNREIVVDVCLCNTDLCNKEMGPMPETTSTAKSTTTNQGNEPFCDDLLILKQI